MSTTLTPNLMSDNVNESVVYYRDQLGFHFFAGVLAEDQSMADGSLAREYAPAGDLALGASATLYLEVENLDELIAGLGESVEIVLPDHTTFYGMREMWIRDNNGYILTLAEKQA
ncbi:MAG: hypothetical protein P8178_14790 [Candidatus Thiodiazotropha sp.]